MLILETMSIAYVALISLVAMSESDPFIEKGFTTDLIHRDSPLSPSYDPSLSHSERIVNALKRSFNRAQRFNTKQSKYTPETDMIPTGGEYLMKYLIGTPPVPSLGIADTGSNLIWTQCQPCIKCFNQSLPVFRPKNSSTYKKIPCDSKNCESLNTVFCTRQNNCLYHEAYGDGSFSRGELASDTFALSSADKKIVYIPKVKFGCGFKNGGIFTGIESGIVGLGSGKGSLIRELGSLAQGKFAYCLVPLSNQLKTSKLHFGANAKVSGNRVVSTPLVIKNPEPYYYLTLNGISIGNQMLDNNKSGVARSETGNMIIDSGTTLTFLPTSLYNKLANALKSSIKLEEIKDPKGWSGLCFLARKDEHVRIPKITVHFKGADLKLKQENILVRTSDVSLCLAATPTEDLAIYGNIAQMNFLVGFDLAKRTVSFKNTDCGKY